MVVGKVMEINNSSWFYIYIKLKKMWKIELSQHNHLIVSLFLVENKKESRSNMFDK